MPYHPDDLNMNSIYDAILLRYGEIGLKGANRGFFERVLIDNIRRALNGCAEANVETVSGRILIKARQQQEEIIQRMSTVFGLVSMSRVIRTGADMESFFDACLRLAGEAAGPTTFRVDCRRADKHFSVKSPDVCRILGERLLQARPAWKVDLQRPEMNFHVEIRPGEALVYAHSTPGLGGMPVGCSGRALLLLSGGLDSPVAGWMSMKRGIKITGIHFHSYPYTGERSQKKVIKLAERLAVYNRGDIELYMINIASLQDSIVSHSPEKYRVTLLRRMMLRMAETIAVQERYGALITGESVGQVASQTLESMSVISRASSMLQLRPLAGLDKLEIMDTARKIGTYDLSILPYEDCCSLFVPRHPATKPGLAAVLEAERSLDWEARLAEALSGMEKHKISV